MFCKVVEIRWSKTFSSDVSFFLNMMFLFCVWPYVCMSVCFAVRRHRCHRRCPTWPYVQGWHKASYIFLYSLSIWVLPHKQKNKHILIMVDYSCQMINMQQRRIRLDESGKISRKSRERRIARQFKLICHLKREAAGMWVNSSFFSRHARLLLTPSVQLISLK